MVIIHHDIELTRMTVCGLEAVASPGRAGAVDLAHAIRKLEYMSINRNRNPQLCRGCWEHQIEKLQDMLTEPNGEIVEGE